jgi:hypothetical protein
MLRVSSRSRSIHAIIDALTRDYIAHGREITVLPTAYVAPVQQTTKHRAIAVPVKKEPELYDTFSF